MPKLLLSVVLVFALGGCANPVAQFYQGMTDVRSHPRYDARETGVRIHTSDNLPRDERELFRRGYARIGQASFNASDSAVSEAHVREQAAVVGAHVVLVASRQSHTAAGAMPVAIPTTSTAYSTGMATATGRTGTATAYGSGITTTRGSQMVMVPYSVRHLDFGIVFFAKQKQRVGVLLGQIDDETRRRLETNAGVRVEAVAEGSPAFDANVLPGDILLSIAGEPVSSLDGYLSIVKKYERKQVPFNFDRDGKRIDKQIEIRSFP